MLIKPDFITIVAWLFLQETGNRKQMVQSKTQEYWLSELPKPGILSDITKPEARTRLPRAWMNAKKR